MRNKPCKVQGPCDFSGEAVGETDRGNVTARVVISVFRIHQKLEILGISPVMGVL